MTESFIIPFIHSIVIVCENWQNSFTNESCEAAVLIGSEESDDRSAEHERQDERQDQTECCREK
jgi:hypothetical protein